MTRFSLAVQLVCLGALGSLLIYMLALVGAGRLSARVTVSWIVADLIAIAAILMWGRLPVIAFTSALGNRELLVVLAVLFFSFIAYLMLDSLQRISAHAAQIARLAQQIALLEEASAAAADRRADSSAAPPTAAGAPDGGAPAAAESPLGQTMLAIWIVLCVATYVVQAYGELPPWLNRLLSAAYLE